MFHSIQHAELILSSSQQLIAEVREGATSLPTTQRAAYLEHLVHCLKSYKECSHAARRFIAEVERQPSPSGTIEELTEFYRGTAWAVVDHGNGLYSLRYRHNDCVEDSGPFPVIEWASHANRWWIRHRPRAAVKVKN